MPANHRFRFPANASPGRFPGLDSDFAPTAAALAGALEAPGLDGIDISAYLFDSSQGLGERELY